MGYFENNFQIVNFENICFGLHNLENIFKCPIIFGFYNVEVIKKTY